MVVDSGGLRVGVNCALFSHCREKKKKKDDVLRFAVVLKSEETENSGSSGRRLGQVGLVTVARCYDLRGF